MIPDNTIKIEPPQTTDAAIIWLHGLGADGHDFATMPQALNHPNLQNTRYIFPHAPVRPVSLNGGLPMRAWYDITSLDRTGMQDSEGLAASGQIVEALIQEQLQAGIPADRIVLAGFSQGGAQVLYSGIRSPHLFAGILGLSCYLPDAANVPTTNKSCPIMLMHGKQDDVIRPEYAQESAERLQQTNHPVELKYYHVGHGVCPEEIADINRWLGERLA
jgi:phospholipase/carboxylesterase